MSKLTMAIAVIICIALIALIPIISIWALNTLFVGVIFKAPIELTLWTYLAMLWFGGMLGIGTHSVKT